MPDSEKQNAPAHAAPAGPASASAERRSAVLRAALRTWWPLLVAVPAGVVAGGGYALVATPQYQADAYVMVVADQGADSATAVSFAQAYGRVVAQPEILAAAAAETGVPVRELTAQVQAQTSPDAPMIQITGTATGATAAAKEANAVARSLVAFGSATTKQTHVRLMAFAQAAAPTTASTPSRRLDVAVGGAAGVLLGSLALLARSGGGGAGGLGRQREELDARGRADGTPLPEQQRDTAGAGA